MLILWKILSSFSIQRFMLFFTSGKFSLVYTNRYMCLYRYRYMYIKCYIFMLYL